MDDEELCSKLPEAITNSITDEVAHPGTSFIEHLVTSTLPTSTQSTIDGELKRTFALFKFKTLDAKVHRNEKKKRLSQKRRRELGLYKVYRKGMKYKEFQPLHTLWTEYMRSYLDLEELEQRGFTCDPGNKYWNQFSQLLMKADFHGAHLKVVRSVCSSLVGKSGIVVFDTKNTFKLIGTDNIVRTIPKESCVFTITLDSYTWTVFGKYFCYRPQDRSVKKVRTHIIADL
ncbi:ribonuclease P protein subunit p29 [Periplaneta americana]|uniref:ribonuclease P protein subunit p29 n=1 Tax=Periplaneta americana TaxID=6978 RepID=UPI0037E864C5